MVSLSSRTLSIEIIRLLTLCRNNSSGQDFLISRQVHLCTGKKWGCKLSKFCKIFLINIVFLNLRAQCSWNVQQTAGVLHHPSPNTLTQNGSMIKVCGALYSPHDELQSLACNDWKINPIILLFHTAHESRVGLKIENVCDSKIS